MKKGKLLFAHCKKCRNGQLEVFFSHHSIGAYCSLCGLVVFEVTDFEKFLKQMAYTKCDHCNSGGEIKEEEIKKKVN